MENNLKSPRADRYPLAHDDVFDVFFEKMDSHESDVIGRPSGVEKPDWFYIDPFVDCAYEYDNREELLGKWFRVNGFWSLRGRDGKDVFIVRERGMYERPELLSTHN